MLKKVLDFVGKWLKEQKSRFEGAVPKARRWRIVYLLSTIIAPWGSLLLVANQKFGEAEWQDGQFSTYVELTFSNEVWTLFTPFLIFSSVAMALLLLNPRRFSRYSLVRFGIYTGAILAIQFSLQIALTTLRGLFLIGAIAIPVALVGISTLMLAAISLYLQWQHRPKSRRVLGIMAAALALICVLFGFAMPEYAASSFGGLILLPLLGVFSALITLCAPIALLTSGLLLTSHEIPKAKFALLPLLSLGWIGGYAVAWYAAVNRVFDLYDQIPNQPNCYIATASANAYPFFVRTVASHPAPAAPVRISRQLQILKAGELIFRATAPKLHTLTRQYYDIYGRRIAARINNPLAATVSYLLLKPLEWITFCFIRLVLPQQLPTISRFYKTV